MKTKFSIEIHANGEANEALIRMITNHNEGKVNINLQLLFAYCRAYYAQWPTISPDFAMIESIGNHTIYLSENGKPTLTIIEKEIVGEINTEDSKLTVSETY